MRGDVTAKVDWLPVCFTGTGPETRVYCSPDQLEFCIESRLDLTRCRDMNISLHLKNVQDVELRQLLLLCGQGAGGGWRRECVRRALRSRRPPPEQNVTALLPKALRGLLQNPMHVTAGLAGALEGRKIATGDLLEGQHAT